MNSIKKMCDVADRFQDKLIKQAQQPIISQVGTTELFFGNEHNQRAFNSAISGGTVAKFLTDMATKSQKSTGFDLKAMAEPHKHASWILHTTPVSVGGIVSKLLDAEFKKIVGKSMNEQMQLADAGAKNGGGSGIIDIGSFNADMD